MQFHINADCYIPDEAPMNQLLDARREEIRTSGYVVVRSVFTGPEAAVMCREADRLLARTELIDTDNIRCRWQNHCETGECRFDCFDPVIDLSDPFAEVARDPRLLDLAGALYGEQAFLFKDKLIYKP